MNRPTFHELIVGTNDLLNDRGRVLAQIVVGVPFLYQFLVGRLDDITSNGFRAYSQNDVGVIHVSGGQSVDGDKRQGFDTRKHRHKWANGIGQRHGKRHEVGRG